MSHESFVRRAPEIAEEILAKTAKLPESLKPFTRNLFEKEASQDTDRLRLPARMTLADLQKLASGNKVDLPKVASVKAEEYGSVADGLRKIASRAAEETKADVLAAAVTILEKDAARAAARAAVRPPRAPRPPAAPPAAVGSGVQPKQHFLGGMLWPSHRAEHVRWKQLFKAEEAKIPETAAYKAREAREAFGLKEKAETEALKQSPELKRQLIGTLPMAGLAVGVPLAAAAALRGGKNKEESVKIYK